MMRLLALCVAGFLVVASPVLAAGAKTADEAVLGFVEWIVLDNPSLRLKARLDTGASTASLHATGIEEFKRNGKRWVRFELPLDEHREMDGPEFDAAMLTFERRIKRTIRVKNKGAAPQRRHVVVMDFCINGKQHEAQFSLTDRGGFHYPALLGRRFMAGKILVDSADSFLARSECDFRPFPL